MKGIVADVKAAYDQFSTPVIVDGKGPGASLIAKLEDAGVVLEVVDSAFVCDSAELVLDATESGELEHFDQPELNEAVDVAAWRSIGERKAYGRRKSVGSISPLEAISLAAKAASDLPPSDPQVFFL